MNSIPDILKQIVECRRGTLSQEHASIRTWLDQRAGSTDKTVPSGRTFLESISDCTGPAIIAEIKLGSPKLGDLRAQIDPNSLAQIYKEAGAVAISVVTEPDFFHGSYDLLTQCRETAGLPALCKDFVVDPIQISLAYWAGAGACLLIAALYSEAELHELADRIDSTGMVPFVECHSAEDVSKLGRRDWPLVGINNRDLRTFEVDLSHSIRLLDQLPVDSIKVAESGIADHTQVDRLFAAGFDAFLVGESLVLDSDPGSRLRELKGELVL